MESLRIQRVEASHSTVHGCHLQRAFRNDTSDISQQLLINSRETANKWTIRKKKMQIEIACNILEDYIVCFNAYEIITLNFDLCAIQWLSTHYDKYPSTPKIFLHMWNKSKIPRGQLCAHTMIWHPVNSFPWLVAVTFGTFTSFSIPSQISSDTDWKPGNLLPSAPSLVFSCHTQYFKC